MCYPIKDIGKIFGPNTHPEKSPYKLIVFKRRNKMDTQELYELLSKQITEVETRLTQQIAKVETRLTKRLESLDARLRNVEVDVAEIKGQKAGWDSARNWVSTGIALVALGVAIAVALWK